MIEFDHVQKTQPSFTGVCRLTRDQAVFWYKNGKCHREDGPACIWDELGWAWLFEGEYHRIGGPATWHPSWPDLYQYYIHGKKFSKKDYWNHPLVVKNALTEILNND